VGAFGSLIAFTTTSKQPVEQVMEFRLKLARLMSALHANALDFISGDNLPRSQKALGVGGLDPETLKLMNVCEDETLIYVLVQWIQQMILHNMSTGVITTPPPIVSRVFQDLSTGIVTLNNVRKISETPFPFPYAQTLSTIIVLHAAITPFVFAVWTENAAWAGVFTYSSVFLFSCINFIAAQIEHPFGQDPNDIDLVELQAKFNNILVVMLSPQCTQRPQLKQPPGNLADELMSLVENSETCEEAFENSLTKEERDQFQKEMMRRTVEGRSPSKTVADLVAIDHNMRMSPSISGRIVATSSDTRGTTLRHQEATTSLEPLPPPSNLQLEAPSDSTVPRLVAAIEPPTVLGMELQENPPSSSMSMAARKSEELEFDAIFLESKCPNMRIGARTAGASLTASSR
jgi:hypothetical protein